MSLEPIATNDEFPQSEVKQLLSNAEKRLREKPKDSSAAIIKDFSTNSHIEISPKYEP